LGRLPHACILEGPQGTGKHTIAKMTAAALVCEAHEDPSLPIPCLRCPSCRKVLEGKSPDVITVGTEEKATLGVDTVRFLKEDVRVIPNDSEHKVYIIEDADKMTQQAQNAFLLTLEEPPAYAHFFLLCQNAELLLETIRSRAPVFRTEPIPTEEIDRYLCEHDTRAAQMKLASPKEYKELLMASAMGIGRALACLDPKTFSPVKQNRATASDFIRIAIQKEGMRELLYLLVRFPTKRDSLQEILQSILNALRDLILLKKSDNAPLIFYVDREQAIELCDCAPIGFLFRFQEAVRCAMDENVKNANVRLLLIKMAISANLLS
jgi:DNA polymerase-3 subunit delta'